MEEKKVSRQDELLGLNWQRAVFYDTSAPQRKFKIIMKSWRTLCRRMSFLMEHAGMWRDVYSLQKQWIGPLFGKKVLDFGCFDGKTLSEYLASSVGCFLWVDLSQETLNCLEEHFKEKSLHGAGVQCVDVLSKDSTETGFDLISAQGLLHHLKPIDLVLRLLQEKLDHGGRIVALDPLQTSLLTRSVRAVYHQFRVDREWEWSFRRDTFATILPYFHIPKLQEIVGYSNRSTPFVFLSKNITESIGRFLHARDIRLATCQKRHLWGCMQVAMCLELRYGNN